MDAGSKTRLGKVHPELAKRVERTIDALAAAGLDVRVVQGLRTYAEQNVLYAQGRTRKGPKVTNARGGQSNHNFGLAVDLCPFVDGSPDWNDHHAFTQIGAAGKTQHLEWGGDWTSFTDLPHLQLKTGMATHQCADLFTHGGLDAVWREASKRLGLDHTVIEKPAAVEQPKPNLPVEAPQTAAIEEPAIIEPADTAQPPPVTTTVEKKTIETTPTDEGGQQQTTTTETQAPTVEVKKESPSWLVKIGAPFTALAGLGINLGSLIQTKIEEMTPQQIGYLIAALALVVVGIWWWTKAAKAAQIRTMQLVDKAADKDATTVKLVA